MRLLIDIPDKVYENIKGGLWCGDNITSNAIENGTPIPDNATRYDIAKLFYGTDDAIDLFNELQMGKEWWNAPYQKGGEG